MIEILIADDEKLIRAGIAKMISKSIENIELKIVEAKNGQEALEICKTDEPQVLITDIRMPIMDGVELMKNVSALENKPKIIVLSGFDDFVYAKSAIQNGALSYILKPVDKTELINAVEQAITEFRKTEKQKTEDTLKNIINDGHVSDGIQFSDSDFVNGYYCVNILGKNCKKTVAQVLENVNYYTLEIKKHYESIIIPREAEYLIKSDFSLDTFAIGISSLSNNITSLRFYKKQAFIAVLQSFFSENKKGIFRYDESALTDQSDLDFTNLNDKCERCFSKLSVSSPEEIQKSINEIFVFKDSNQNIYAEELYFIYNKITENLMGRFAVYTQNDLYLDLKCIMIENILQCKNIAEWKKNVTDYAIYLSELLKKDNVEYPFIDEALAYIKSNFNKNINMAMVANEVSVNYTWFSEKFKEHIGMNFNEYIKKLRLDEACRLLEKNIYKVYEVAERSGFGDVKYFMKTFKEATGLTPSEWKKQHVVE